MLFEYSDNKKLGKCQVKGCRNGARKHKKKGGEISYGKICWTHQGKQQKIENPVRYYYDILRSNAKRRKKKFTLTVCYFKLFCLVSGYLDKKGIKGNDFNIDRIDPNKGYEAGNIQLMTNAQNLKKRWADDMIAKKNGMPTTEKEFKEYDEWRNQQAAVTSFPTKYLDEDGNNEYPELGEAPF